MSAKIVEWNDQKGYGFLQVGKNRVFLHRSDFTEHHKRPAVGDVICFTMGQDAKGRMCAVNAVHLNDGGRITAASLLLLVCLLMLPAFALYRHGAYFRWAVAYVLVMGAISYRCYVLDKKAAREKSWRFSENGLHLTELLGGWPGAFLAQRRLRHKISKANYQIIFWVIVLAHQFAAYDSLQNWQRSRQAWNYFSHPETRTKAIPSMPVIEIITNRF